MNRLALVVLFAAIAGCAPKARRCAEPASQAGGGPRAVPCAVSGFEDRDFLLYAPDGHDPAKPAPLVFLLHGGGGNKEGANRLTCPGGDEDSPQCLAAVLGRRGYLVVAPDGLAPRFGNMRTWNAGGGADGFRCVSGRACKDGSDDVAYLDAVFAEVSASAAVDATRVYATGMSNGAAMSHRLACERGDRFAAIAPVGGANQFAAVQACAPPRPVPVLQVHGREDPCWGYEGGDSGCLQQDDARVASVMETVIGDEDRPGWARLNGCAPAPERISLPDPAADDGTSVTRERWSGCQQDAEVVLLTVEGGGHTWPRGWQYLGERRIGRTSQDIDANERIAEFFEAHRTGPR